MNLVNFREMIGSIVVFRPRPKVGSGLLKDSHNSWIIVDEVEDRVFMFKNTITNHQFQLGEDNVDKFQTPRFLILRGQVILKDAGETEFEPFSPGIMEDYSLSELVDETSQKRTDQTYQELKGYVGKKITVRFPSREGMTFGSGEVILDKCTPLFITVRQPMREIRPPDWAIPLGQSYMPIPEKIASVPLDVVKVAEDIERSRPMVFFDYSYWNPEQP